MNEKITKLGDSLMELTTAEALELQNYLESKGLKPAQPTVVATATTVNVEEKKESENVNLVLINKGSSTMKLVKAIIPITGKSAMDSKKLTDELPAVILANIPRAVGKEHLSSLANELGEDVVFELQDC